MGKIINISGKPEKTIDEMVTELASLNRETKYSDCSESRGSKVLSFEKEAKKRKEKEFIKLVLTETPNFGLREESTDRSPLKKVMTEKEKAEIIRGILLTEKNFGKE